MTATLPLSLFVLLVHNWLLGRWSLKWCFHYFLWKWMMKRSNWSPFGRWKVIVKPEDPFKRKWYWKWFSGRVILNTRFFIDNKSKWWPLKWIWAIMIGVIGKGKDHFLLLMRKIRGKSSHWWNRCFDPQKSVKHYFDQFKIL